MVVNVMLKLKGNCKISELRSSVFFNHFFFLPPQIRYSFEYWAALPEHVYWAQKKIVITKCSEMAEGEAPEPV